MMARIVLFLILGCFLYVKDAAAYEFLKVHKLFDTIESEYADSADLKKLSIKGGAVLSEFDDSFRLYNSDSKAFLYEKDMLIGTFEFPKTDDVPALWLGLLEDILKTGINRSQKISGKEQDLEDRVLRTLAQNIDKYSRIEPAFSEQAQFKHDVYDNILYLQLSSFSKGCADKIRGIIESHRNIEGIILDLRNNRGGHFNEAIKTADLFLDNAIIAFSREKKHPERYYASGPGDIAGNKPIVILTNELTASAAEIVTAALSEQSRAVVVGTRTFGKGSIQNIYKINDKTLYITSGYFYSPSGKSIQENGIVPQICTGINNSCRFSDKENPRKDIMTAIDLIKTNLS